jgi:hypothetical protein
VPQSTNIVIIIIMEGLLSQPMIAARVLHTFPSATVAAQEATLQVCLPEHGRNSAHH